MKPLRSIVLILVPFLVAGVADARAQRIPSPYEFIEHSQEGGAFVGVLEPGSGRFDTGPRGGPLVGVRYSVHVNGPVNFDAWASYLSGERWVIDPSRPAGDRKVGRADADLVLLEGSLKFSLMGQRTWNRLGPYLLAGGGIAVDAAGDQEADLEIDPENRFDFGSSFIGHLGAGVRWLPIQRFAVRADGRFTLWQLDTPEGYFDQALDLNSPQESEWVSGISVTVGAAILF